MSASTAMPSAIPIPPRLMIVAGAPATHIAANASSKTSGKRQQGDEGAPAVQEKEQRDDDDDRHLLDRGRAASVWPMRAIEIGAVVGDRRCSTPGGQPRSLAIEGRA